MILTPFNSSTPDLWGKELKFILNGEIVGDNPFKQEIPNEFDFVTAFYPKDPQGARRYYAQR